MPEPNPEQATLIDGTEGVYLVDAGAGTGKTFAVTRRYAAIVDRDGIEPEDVLLATFTESAASEMRERIVARSSYGVRELADAPIGTFHSQCLDLLRDHGHEAPTHLGIDDRLSPSTRIVEDDLQERRHFRTFLARFREDHPEHADRFRAIDDPASLLDLVRQLAARGVFPTATGWHRDGESTLDGDSEAFERRLAEVNAPRNDGSKQSRIRESLGRYDRDACYPPNAPSKETVRGPRGSKRIPADVAQRAFGADRTGLKAFVHDVYFEYLRYALGRNFLNFAFLQLFAFVLLCEDDGLRESASYEYVMIDEFQDTSEIQFKLALLMAGTDNLCVVGDWKQSIYSFQYADVENITAFEDRLERFAAELNADRQRVTVDASDVRQIELRENYRSTASILDLAAETLTVRATSTDDVDADAVRDRLVSLRSNAPVDASRLEGIRHEDEHEAVLSKVQEIVGNDDYAVTGDDGDRRPPTYDDVTVLTRTRAWGRDLLRTARAQDVPVCYDGGIELCRTDEAKLLLAWLRIAERDADRGWAVVLERAGYLPDEIQRVLDREAYPDDARTFRDELADLETVGALARRVFDRYGMAGAHADVLLEMIESLHRGSTLTRGDLIDYLVRGIETGATHEVTASEGTDAVTVQTIHAAKGREYPIVILANMNEHAFPPAGGSSPTVSFQEPIGLRQSRRYGEDHGHPHVYDDWRTAICRHCVTDGRDEERRLLYVATTRAESHVIYAAGSSPNAFLEALPVTVESHEPDVRASATTPTEQTRLPISVPTPEGPRGYTPHSLMAEDVFEGANGGRGTDFGSRVHAFAERYARGDDVDPVEEPADEAHVAAFLDSLDGELRPEVEAVLPLEVDGERVAISGVVDLVAVGPETVTVVDYKTDLNRNAQAEYRTQLSVYAHVVAAAYPDRDVTAMLFYTAEGDPVSVEPRSTSSLADLVRRRRSTAGR